MTDTGFRVRASFAGWTFKLDRYGIALHDTGRWAADLAAEAFVEAAAEVAADHDDDPCACDDADPDQPEPVVYRVEGDAMWSLLEDAAIEARNGSTPQEAADSVLATVEMRHIEVTAEEEP